MASVRWTRIPPVWSRSKRGRARRLGGPCEGFHVGARGRDALEPFELRPDASANAPEGRRHHFCFPWANARVPGVCRDETRRAGDRIGFVNEKRVIVHLVVVPEAVDRDDVAGSVPIAVLVEVSKKIRPARVRHLLFVGDLEHVEPIRMGLRELDESLDAALVVDAERRKVERAHYVLARAAARSIPRASGALERIRDEIDAALRDSRATRRVED